MGHKHLPGSNEVRFRLPDEQYEELKRRAQEKSQPLAEYFRTVVAAHLGVATEKGAVTAAEIRELGDATVREYRRRLAAGEKIGDTAMKSLIEYVAGLLEKEAEKQAHGGVDPEVVDAVFRKVQDHDDCFLGFLKDCWKQKRIPRPHTAERVRDYAVLLEAELGQVRAFAAEVSGAR